MSWLGDLVGAVVAAPARILNLPVKVMEAAFDERAAEQNNELDDVADAVEEQAKKVVDGNERKPV